MGISEPGEAKFVAALLGTRILASLSPEGDKFRPFAPAQIIAVTTAYIGIFARETIMAIDPRDAIWNETYALLYRASYAANLETGLLARWVWLDSITKIAVAIASGGAALAGLVFWKNSDYTFLWPMFTSASALLAIISKQLSIAEKLTTHTTSAVEFGALTIDIGSLIVRMKIHSDFPIAEFEKKLLGFRSKYRAEVSRSPHDLLLTTGLRYRAQATVDSTLSYI